MSSSSDTQLDRQAVLGIAHLARLSLSEQQAEAYSLTLNKILASMQHLQGIDTTGVAPLRSPFDGAQPLRDDVVSENNQRDVYQAVAPATQDGLYLVPRVIE